MAETSHDGWYSETQATFGDRLEGAREALGLSQAELARQLGVSLGTLRAWEEDVRAPRANRLQMMAGALNVSIRWLLTGEGPGLDAPPPPPVEVSHHSLRKALGGLEEARRQMRDLGRQIDRLERDLKTMIGENA